MRARELPAVYDELIWVVEAEGTLTGKEGVGRRGLFIFRDRTREIAVSGLLD